MKTNKYANEKEIMRKHIILVVLPVDAIFCLHIMYSKSKHVCKTWRSNLSSLHGFIQPGIIFIKYEFIRPLINNYIDLKFHLPVGRRFYPLMARKLWKK